jgi:hypothetical protein
MNLSRINPKVGDVVELWREYGKHIISQRQVAIIEDVRRWYVKRGHVKQISLTLREVSFNGNRSTPQTPGHRFEVCTTYGKNRKIRKLPEAEAAVILVHES